MAVMQASESNINFVKTRIASPDGKLWGKAPGMVLMKPTSIDYSGTSATLGENGQVTFNAVTSLSLNGCFTADFDNYVVSIRSGNTTDANMSLRLRSSSTDDSGSNHTYQNIIVNGTAVSAGRGSSTTAWILGTHGTNGKDGLTLNIYGPNLSQPTAGRWTGMTSYATVIINDSAFTHSLSNSYDGFTLFMASGSVTGALTVYGVRS